MQAGHERGLERFLTLEQTVHQIYGRELEYWVDDKTYLSFIPTLFRFKLCKNMNSLLKRKDKEKKKE